MPLLFTCCAIAARSAAVDILYGLPDEPSPPEKDAALAVVVGIINTAAAINSSNAIRNMKKSRSHTAAGS